MYINKIRNAIELGRSLYAATIHMMNRRWFRHRICIGNIYGTLIEKIDDYSKGNETQKSVFISCKSHAERAIEIVDPVLTAFVSSSKGNHFGNNCFLSRSAIAASGGEIALGRR